MYRVSYSASLIGTIKSHLAGLQGFDVMALELIQNADDAKASEIEFDVTDQGLVVRNSGQFSSCGNLQSECQNIKNGDSICDFHRIIVVGNGAKLQNKDYIGRFGIGFVSTYQVTNHPEITSNGIKLTLKPDSRDCVVEIVKKTPGTQFFLPWADDPSNEVRTQLGTSAIGLEQIRQLELDVQTVLRKSLLFLKHVKQAVLKRNSQIILSCRIERSENSTLTIRYSPGDYEETWNVLFYDANEEANALRASYPLLEKYDRNTTVSIALRLSPKPLEDGLIYIYLPTEQSTGLPFHINADFFPEPSRKAAIFKGQHEQKWNEMLIDAAARKLSSDPEYLLNLIGPQLFWQILLQAHSLAKPIHHPLCFSQFWIYLKDKVSKAKVVQVQDQELQLPRDVFYSDKPFNSIHLSTLLNLNIRIVLYQIQDIRRVLLELGTPVLNLDCALPHISTKLKRFTPGISTTEKSVLDDFFVPIWEILDMLLPINPGSLNTSPINTIRNLPLLLTENLLIVSINQSYSAPSGQDPNDLSKLLPFLSIAHRKSQSLQNFYDLIRRLSLKHLCFELNRIAKNSDISESISTTDESLEQLYSLLADLDKENGPDSSPYTILIGLKIWKSGDGLVSLTSAQLPGNFKDPTNSSTLLDPSLVKTQTVREFITSKLCVKTLSIDSFVQDVVPRLFTGEGPINPELYSVLISELSKHSRLLVEGKSRSVLVETPLIPTQDNGWAKPSDTYRKTDELVKVFGNSKHLWVDELRMPSTKDVESFVDGLGILRSPSAKHLSFHILSIAENNSPSDSAKQNSARAFYSLCKIFKKADQSVELKEAVNRLKSKHCLPAEENLEVWFKPEQLFAPYSSEGFKSQANILDFKSQSELNRDLLDAIGVNLDIPTQLIIKHLLNCVKSNKQPHNTTYKLLNDRVNTDPSITHNLSDIECVFSERLNRFLRPNQLYWTVQQLGKFAFKVPESYQNYRNLLVALGVKDSPSAADYAVILVDIVRQFRDSDAIDDQSLSVYYSCMVQVANACQNEEINDSEIEQLEAEPFILNTEQKFVYRDEAFIADSEWYSSLFDGALDSALAKPKPETVPFLQSLGVKTLSSQVSIALERTTGQKREELEIKNQLFGMIELIRRLLTDVDSNTQRLILDSIRKMQVFSFDSVSTRAHIELGNEPIESVPKVVPAHFDITNNITYLSRPVQSKTWLHIFNSLFHQNIPQENGNSISRRSMSLCSILNLSLSDAHAYLTEAGVPVLDSSGMLDIDLTSPDIENYSLTDESRAEFGESRESEYKSNNQESLETQSDFKFKSGANYENATHADSSGKVFKSEFEEYKTRSTGTSDHRKRGTSNGSIRSKSKGNRDQRMLSYVEKSDSSNRNTSTENGSNEHNLAVEEIARDAVCNYERLAKREPIEMPQTHPGFDIRSYHPTTKEERFIEVKGLNGAWNLAGVGLSKYQFKEAQELRDKFWLYVVEYVSDRNKLRIFPIQDPTSIIASFMFDSNWREVARLDREHSTKLFVPNARIEVDNQGKGTIVQIREQFNSKILHIRFDGSPQNTILLLNLASMRVID